VIALDEADVLHLHAAFTTDEEPELQVMITVTVSPSLSLRAHRARQLR
jgi:hypothetical protein